MQAVIQSLESMVLALAVAAFAHFGVAMKVCHCPKSQAAVASVAYPRPATPRTIRRVTAPLADDLHRA